MSCSPSDALLLQIQNAASLSELMELEEVMSQSMQMNLLTSSKDEDTSDSKVMADKAWLSFSVEASAFHADLFLLQTLLNVCAQDPQSCNTSEAPLNCLLNEDTWKLKLDELFDRFTTLMRAVPTEIARLEPLKEERQLLEAVKEAGNQAMRSLQNEAGEKASASEEIQSVLAALKVLNEWTEKQVVSLESIQEDSKSLQGFAYEVEEPIHKVLEKSQSLLARIGLSSKDSQLLTALKEFNEMRLYFLSSLRNRLDCVLCELHDNKPLELLVSECVTYLKRLPSFIEEIDDLQLLPASHDSLIVANRADDFQRVLEAWAERYTLLRSSLQLFYQSSLSGLTWLPADESLIVQSAQRQQEFETISRELQDWAEEESHSDSWREVYGTIVSIKNRVSLLME